MFGLSRTAKWIVIGIAVAALVFTHVAAYWAGGDGCERRNAEKQLELNERLDRADEEIDLNTPYTADKRTAIKWLRQHAR